MSVGVDIDSYGVPVGLPASHIHLLAAASNWAGYACSLKPLGRRF